MFLKSEGADRDIATAYAGSGWGSRPTGTNVALCGSRVRSKTYVGPRNVLQQLQATPGGGCTEELFAEAPPLGLATFDFTVTSVK
jgi:hypothetical protein